MLLTNVMASSIDGKISAFKGETDEERRSYGFTNSSDEQRVLKEMYHSDAIIVGAETLRASGKAWAVKNYKGVYPAWMVFTQNGLEEDLPFWCQKDVEKILISKKQLEGKKYWQDHTKSIAYGEESAANFAYQYFKKRGFKKILLFGGAAINSLFYESNLVDTLCLTLSPFIFGNPTSSSLIANTLSEKKQLILESSQVIDNHVFLTYTVKK